MSPRPMTTQELDELPLGSTIVDWEGDHLVNEAPGSWYYRDQPIRGNTPRAFSSETMAVAYSAKLVQRGPDPESEAPTTSRPSIRDRARRAAREEWNRRWTLNQKPTIHTYADAVADAVVAALFPLTEGKLGESKAAPVPMPTVDSPNTPVPMPTVESTSTPVPMPALQHASLRTGLAEDTRHEMEDVLLEYRGTPRRHLFEYPHRDDDSRRMIAEASSVVTRLLAILQRDNKGGK